MSKYFFQRSRAILGFFFLTTFLSFSQSVRPIDEKGLDSLIVHRNGKVLVLNIWATWCVPCREEFPDLIKVSNDLMKNKIEFASISVDDPDELQSKILPFLRALNAPFNVFVSTVVSQDTLINKINKDWSGGIPATFIFDRKGKQRKYLLGIQSYEQFKKAIMDVLNKS